jgi:CDP-glucose 4,6-dehydratase
MNLELLKSGPVFLTGHTGFKGAWLTVFLENLGIEVIGYALESEQDSLYETLNRKGKIRETFGDIRNFENLKKALQAASPKYVLHFAAQALVTDAYQDPIGTFEVNSIGTANLLEACRRTASIERIGIVTTDKVYENKGTGRAFLEADPLGADDPYSASKVASEQVIRAWQTIYSTEKDIDILALRAGNVIGGGDLSPNRLLSDIVKSRFENKELDIRFPDSSRPWQHALDPLWGYLSALTAPKSKIEQFGRSFNFGPNSQSMRVRDVIAIAEDFWPNQIKAIYPSNENQLYEASLLDLNSDLAQIALQWNPIWSQTESVLKTLFWWDAVKMGKLSPMEACMLDIDDALDYLNLPGKNAQ